MTRKPRLTGKNGRKRSDTPDILDPDTPGKDYRVGPGRPPREFQFKPGQSGNPKGARPKASSIAPDLKTVLERALSKTVTLRQGEKGRIVTMATAGIEQLVNQFAKGDRHARRDLMDLAPKLGVDLTAGQGKAIESGIRHEETYLTEAEVKAELKARGLPPQTIFQVRYHEMPAEDSDPYGDDGGDVADLQPVKPLAEPKE
jgi:hypothetical protein